MRNKLTSVFVTAALLVAPTVEAQRMVCGPNGCRVVQPVATVARVAAAPVRWIAQAPRRVATVYQARPVGSYGYSTLPAVSYGSSGGYTTYSQSVRSYGSSGGSAVYQSYGSSGGLGSHGGAYAPPPEADRATPAATMPADKPALGEEARRKPCPCGADCQCGPDCRRLEVVARVPSSLPVACECRVPSVTQQVVCRVPTTIGGLASL